MDNIEIKKSIDQNGFAYLPSFLKKSKSLFNALKKIREVSELRLSKYSCKKNDLNNLSLDELLMKLQEFDEKNLSFINDVMNAHQSILDLFNDKKIIDLVDQILPNKNSFICVNNHRFRVQSPGRDVITNLPWHQDSHYNTMSSGENSIAVWVSLSDINNSMGPVIFKKGSHKMGSVERTKYVKPNGNTVYTIEEKYINDKSYEEISFPSKAGDLILIHMDVLHISGKNKSSLLSKISAQARFHQAASKNFLTKYDS